MQNMKLKPGKSMVAFAKIVLTLAEEAFPRDELSYVTCRRFIIFTFLGNIIDGPLLRSLLKVVHKYNNLQDLIPFVLEYARQNKLYNRIWCGKDKPVYTPAFVLGRVKEEMDISNIRILKKTTMNKDPLSITMKQMLS